MDDFFQNPPQLGNQYDEDRVLKKYLQWKLPADILTSIEPGLQRLGQRAVTDIYHLGQEAEAMPPQHIPYDPWGRRIDHIKVSPAWQALDRIAAEEELIATGYKREQGIYSRLHQFARLYLFHPSSAIYSCPLAMTDGAARAIELYADDYLKNHALRHLTASDPAQFWTSGQWMTERTGGSDVSGTTTIATMTDAGYMLNGVKWFTSATTSQMAMTLARTQNAPAGSKGLSLFYVELRNADGTLKGIKINRLKEKLGTHALPTAELTLENTPALLVGSMGEGVKKISSLFNITRLYNACCAVGYMRRGLALARDYAHKRVAFGKPLSRHSLHLETLAQMQVEFYGAFHLVFHAIELLGKEELNQARDHERALLRLLTPLAKLYTAKQSIALTSETLEAFGGAGYVEDTGLPQLLRNAQVLSIWEGTTNVLSLDVLRAMAREGATEAFIHDVHQRLEKIQHHNLEAAKLHTADALNQLKHYLKELVQTPSDLQAMGARHLAFSMTRIFTASLLLEYAQWEIECQGGTEAILVAQRWCAKNMTEWIPLSELHQSASQKLAL